MPQCKKRAVEGGLLIRTYTGVDEGHVVCTIGARKDIKHIVWTKNLRAYKARVECISEIAEAGVLAFEQLRTSTSETRWASNYDLDSGEAHGFRGVGVYSLQPGANEQKITVELVVDRIHRGTVERVALSIFVQP